ncbi:ribose 5-phosphate isomerase A [Miltoncostaea marina]|uniref:ribose 5-phosphate isomerase A n=1 Tax=Miltoncostaea marina TaxID=2843215 RepID=UPI001C3C27C4|nr:ribose 5-phosphate isomerase A [Miltoncostaea marina]
MEDGRQRAWDAAGAAAAAQVEDGMRVGLGTGRAAAAGIRALGRRVADGLRCTGVPTSRASDALARELGIPLGRLRGPLDLAFDGADAVDPRGLVVKGAGGALVRERIVADAARRFLVLVDGPKIVRSLDEWGVLPLAVVPFAAGRVLEELADLGARRRPGRSDDGLVIVDADVPPGADWEAVAARAGGLAGVVDHGLFRVPLGDVLVGRPDGGCAPAG